MHPAFSVILLTTLIGAAQGLFLALYTGQLYSLAKLLERQDSVSFYAAGSLLALVLLGLGLAASFFHLGRPERAWRAAARWRSSWLSREVIVLPAFMALVLVYGAVHAFGWTRPWFLVRGLVPVDASLLSGAFGVAAALLLYLATAMIYASVRFLQEWSSSLTVANFALFGLASGFMLAAAFSAWTGVSLVSFYGTWAVIFTLLAAVTRGASLYRNARLKRRSTLQSAIGVRHTRIRQESMGFTGGSFNTREFFHGRSAATLAVVRWFFLLAVFALPPLLLAAAHALESPYLPVLAFATQYLGLLAERWYFFADARHPQNLYYQTVS